MSRTCNNRLTISNAVRHPIFARVYARLSGTMEKEIGVYRDELLEGLSGRILEVGAGNGMNFRHYTEGSDVIAVEPEPYLRAKAEESARQASVPISVVDGTASSLPFEDGSFDTVVTCLVLCSVDDQAAALAEIKRVLKPGGSISFLEHVGSDQTGKARLQRTLDHSRLWPGIAGGCHCGRDTVSAMTAAGFEVTGIRPITLGPAWAHTNPHVIGSALAI